MIGCKAKKISRSPQNNQAAILKTRVWTIPCLLSGTVCPSCVIGVEYSVGSYFQLVFVAYLELIQWQYLYVSSIIKLYKVIYVIYSKPTDTLMWIRV